MELDPIEQKKLKLFQNVDELMEGQAEQQKLAFDRQESRWPTSSEWFWRIIDAIPKLSVTVNPNWLWKKEAYKAARRCTQPKKVVVIYYSTDLLFIRDSFLKLLPEATELHTTYLSV